MRFWTADLHFGHVNIIRYCARPYASVEEMNDDIVNRINAIVGDSDELWIIGDVAMGSIEQSLANVGRINGRKILIPGNHDRCWEGNGSEASLWSEVYCEAGFDRIEQGPLIAKLGDIKVQVSHFPYEGDSHDEDRFSVSRPQDSGGFVLHGHVHTKWRRSDRQVNVGIDAWNGSPVTDRQVLDLIESDEEFVGAVEWKSPR